MKKLSFSIALVLVGLFVFGSMEASPKKKAAKVTWAAEDIKWEAMAGGPPGVMSATLWGDMTKGAYGAFIKFPAGFKAPMHHHTADGKIVVIKGAYTYQGKQYGPGSYLAIPGGDVHESGGLDSSESIFFMESSGKFDLIPEAPKENK